VTLRLLADDLTGALDTAAMFCGARGPVPVLLRPEAVTGDAAFDLACRDGGAEAAVAATRAAAPLLAGADTAFLKIDSLLRGHWAAMLAALWRAGGFRSCVFAPAFPAQGRLTLGGRQWVRAAEGAAQMLPLDPRAALAAQGVADIAVQEAGSDADLAAIVAAGRALPPPVLWCGTAGLAAALAGVAPAAVGVLPGPALGVIGSCHPVSRGQILHCAATGGPLALTLAGAAEEVAALHARLRSDGRALMQAAVAEGAVPAAAASCIRDCLRAVLPALPPPGTLIAAGGETLRAACEALEVARLEVSGLLAPGVPAARLCGGGWDGVWLLSKSGAFGGPDMVGRMFAAVEAFDGE
jgi:uncharacterized protein YgbK (DUF1537 family)